MRTRLLGATFCWLLLVPSWAELALGEENQVLSIADSVFLDGFVTDKGRSVVAVRPPLDEEVRSTLVSWQGGESFEQEIDFVVKWLQEAPGGRFLAWGFKERPGVRRRPDEGSKDEQGERVLGFRVYRATPTAFELEQQF